MTRDAVGGVMGCPRDRLRAVSATEDPRRRKVEENWARFLVSSIRRQILEC